MMLSNMDTARLCRGLMLMLHAGVGLGDGLFLLAREEAGLKKPLETMGASLDDGVPLSDAMEKSGLFPACVPGMVRIGEETGRTEEALAVLAAYYEEQDRTEKQLRMAVAYPAMIFVLMLAVLFVLLVQVLPVFDQVYASLGSRMTGAAAGLLYLGQLMKAALPVLFGVLVFVALLMLALRLNKSLKERVLGMARSRFGDRGVSRKFSNARFARGMAMALRSGLAPEAAAALARPMLADQPGAARRCKACAEALEVGTSLPEAMEQNGLLSPADSRLLQLGIRGGSADTVMENIADRMMEDAQLSLEQTVSRVEPAMVMVSSLLVGLILLAVMLPLMDILSVIG